MIKLPDEGHNFRVNLSEIFNKSAGVKRPKDYNI
jgi:hypothetical protein